MVDQHADCGQCRKSSVSRTGASGADRNRLPLIVTFTLEQTLTGAEATTGRDFVNADALPCRLDCGGRQPVQTEAKLPSEFARPDRTVARLAHPPR